MKIGEAHSLIVESVQIRSLENGISMTSKVSRNRILGAILSGGQARRMGGVVKGMLDIASGRPVVARLIDEFASAGLADVIIVANDPAPYERFALPIVPDLRVGLGPLAGIEAALTWSGRCEEPFDAVAFLPCDLPAITAGEISTLLDAFRCGTSLISVAETGNGFLQALCCIVHNDVLADISVRIDRGQRGVQRAWRSMEAATVHFDDDAPFANINTPDDLDQWKTSGSNDL